MSIDRAHILECVKVLKGYAENRLLVGIGKAQHFVLDLGRKLAAQQAITGAREVAAVVVELG